MEIEKITKTAIETHQKYQREIIEEKQKMEVQVLKQYYDIEQDSLIRIKQYNMNETEKIRCMIEQTKENIE